MMQPGQDVDPGAAAKLRCRRAREITLDARAPLYSACSPSHATPGTRSNLTMAVPTTVSEPPKYTRKLSPPAGCAASRNATCGTLHVYGALPCIHGWSVGVHRDLGARARLRNSSFARLEKAEKRGLCTHILLGSLPSRMTHAGWYPGGGTPLPPQLLWKKTSAKVILPSVSKMDSKQIEKASPSCSCRRQAASEAARPPRAGCPRGSS